MPVKARDLKRAVEALGADFIEARGGGSHWRIRYNGRTYPIPLHNGLKSDVLDCYVRGVCRVLGVTVEQLEEHM